MLELIMIIVAFLLLMLIVVWSHFLRQNQAVEIFDNNQRDDTNVILYHEHKAEIETDFSQGRIDEENYQYLLAELNKSLLQDIEVNKLASKNDTIKDQSISVVWPSIISIFILVFSFAMYTKTGAYDELSKPALTADAHQSTGDPQQSAEQQAIKQIEALKSSIAQEPENSDAWYSLGQTYISVGDFDSAVNAYNKVIEIEGESADLLGSKAQAYYYKNNQKIDGVIQELVDKALTLDPADPSTNILMGMHNFINKDYPNAIIHWQRVVDSGRTNVNAQALEEAIVEAHQRLSTQTNSVLDTAAAASGPQLNVTVKLSDELVKKLSQSEDKVVFIYAISADPARGRMPLAAVKMNASDLPTTVVLNDTRAMSPQAKISDVDVVHIYAIVSSTGGVGIRSGDYKAESLGVSVNSTEPIALVINNIVP